MHEIDDPTVVAEVMSAFVRYEAALVANDIAALDAFFWVDDRTIRYGGSESSYGYSAIAAFRTGRSSADLARTLEKTVITTFGRDFATASTLFRRDSAPGFIGRQMQSWVRMPEGWRVVAAHISIIRES